MENALHTSANLNGNSWLSTLIATTTLRLAQYRTYRRTVQELSELSDRNLADLGLSRSMIEDVARDTAYGA